MVLAILKKVLYTSKVLAGVMELVDVVDSKSTDGDIVPVRVRPPAPINPIVNDTFTMGFIFCTGRTRTVGESLAQAALRCRWQMQQGSLVCRGRCTTEWGVFEN